MASDDKIMDEKLQYDNNWEVAKTASSTGKTDQDEFLTSEDILLSGKGRITEPAEFIYSPLGKAFEKQIKTIKD